MSIGNLLNTLVIGPLKLLMEFIFAQSNRWFSVGFSIFVLSLLVNILVSPLYRQAENVRKSQQEQEQRLALWVKRIKAAFSGDEQFMILQTYYRQNHYSPIHALKGALPLLLQVPFFMAAYQLLSGLSLLQEASLGPIKDLSQPDRLLTLGGWTLNLLPLLMTGINLLSGALYSRGAPLKEKIQILVLASVFLVLLYDSPSGLAFYWTLNNLFSLCRNLFDKIFPSSGRKKRFRLPLPLREASPNPGLFFSAAALMALLTGLLIPSAVLSSSPSEFVERALLFNPLWYMAGSFALGLGTFMLWFSVFYLMAGAPVKKIMEWAFWLLTVLSLLNYMAFPTNGGTLYTTLQYERNPQFTSQIKWINVGVLILLVPVLSFLFLQKAAWCKRICLAAALTVGVMGGINLVQAESPISRTLSELRENSGGTPSFPLSTKGKNVIVFMLDRAEGAFLPSVLAEKPELSEIYDGFVFYPNTLSHGAHTHLGSPGLYGGYEYVPEEMNRRNTELLKDKHNEALLLMPTLFSEAGYTVSVCDPPYAGNYDHLASLSLYGNLKNTNAYLTGGLFNADSRRELEHETLLRNFFCYSLCEIAPSFLHNTLYNLGNYNQPEQVKYGALLQIRSGPSRSSGIDTGFMDAYGVLEKLPALTVITDQEQGTFLEIANNTPHEPMLLSAPEYEPQETVDNTEYDTAHMSRFQAGLFPLDMSDDFLMSHYHVNVASLIQVGKWIEFMKENNVYDNTRIILVADHGIYPFEQPDFPSLQNENESIGAYNPLLLVKDFGSHGPLTTDERFMTNADVPTLAVRELFENPVNPFTGQELPGEESKDSPQMVNLSHEITLGEKAGTTFPATEWYKVIPGDLFQSDHWIPAGIR